jgi:hypothetical protein
MEIKRHIIFVPGKNPKPPKDQHLELLWRTLIEGVRRAEPDVVAELSLHKNDFSLLAWNQLFYNETKDISLDLPWIDVLINTHGPSKDDMREAQHWHKKLSRFLYMLTDYVPYLINVMPDIMRQTALELNRYFLNRHDIAGEIRDMLKQQLKPLLDSDTRILLIGHSLGSVIAYDTLWELAHEDKVAGKIDTFLTLGSPLGMTYVQHRLLGAYNTGALKYPTNIKHWINVSSVGDIMSLNKLFHEEYAEMRELGIIEDIQDHCQGIFNFYHNEEGLNCHRSYGYLVNPAVGKIVADWWNKN